VDRGNARLRRNDQPTIEAISMTRKTALTTALMTGAAALLLGAALPAFAVDEDAAMALAKKSNCTKCHSVDKKKDGPSFKETAAKYKKEGDGEKKLYTHLTTHPKIKVDGKEEEHISPKTQDDAEIKNLIAFILSR
jgi:cytochrome c